MARWVAIACSVSCLLGTSYLATRDPYSIRQLRRGIAYYDRQQYHEAEECLTRAIDANQRDAKAFFWRARARQHGDRELFALEDFKRASELSPSPEIAACRAYCSAMWGSATSAVIYSHEAIRAGFDSAEVYNNLGYVRMRQSSFDSAIDSFNEAIVRNDRLQAALHNRAFAEFRWALKEKRPVDLQACVDIENAIAVGPAAGDLYLHAALIYSRVAQDHRQYDEVIVGHLRNALRLGVGPATVDREFKRRLEESVLRGLCANAVSVENAAKVPRLVDPITNEASWRR